MAFVKVLKKDDLQSGERIVIELDDLYIAVFRVSDNFYAIEDVCTHDGGPLGEGEFEGYEVECRRHGARFDIRDGKALNLPAVKPVPFYPVKVEGEDILIDTNSA